MQLQVACTQFQTNKKKEVVQHSVDKGEILFWYNKEETYKDRNERL